MNEINFTFEPLEYKPLEKHITQKDTLQYILSRKKCDIPYSCINCDFLEDCINYKNYNHKTKKV